MENELFPKGTEWIATFKEIVSATSNKKLKELLPYITIGYNENSIAQGSYSVQITYNKYTTIVKRSGGSFFFDLLNTRHETNGFISFVNLTRRCKKEDTLVLKFIDAINEYEKFKAEQERIDAEALAAIKNQQIAIEQICDYPVIIKEHNHLSKDKNYSLEIKSASSKRSISIGSYYNSSNNSTAYIIDNTKDLSEDQFKSILDILVND